MKSKINKPGILEVAAMLSTIFFFGAMNGGSFLAFLFLYLAPLPLFILGLKKDSPWGGLVGAIAAILIFFVTTPQMALIYLLAVAAPTTYFCEKATSRSDPTHQDWYSLSNLAILLVVPPILVFILASTYFWAHGQGLGAMLLEKTNAIVDLYIVTLKDRGHTINPSISLQLEAIKKSFSNTAPALIAIFWMTLIVLNGLLAQSILKKAKRNQRPVFAIREIEVPRILAITFLFIIVIASFSAGQFGYILTNLAAILAFPVMLAGLGLLHIVASKTNYSSSILFVLYLIITFSRWAAILIVMLGIVDHFLKLRGRFQADNTQ